MGEGVKTFRQLQYNRVILIDALREVRGEEEKKYPNMFFINIRYQWIRNSLNDLNGLMGVW